MKVWETAYGGEMMIEVKEVRKGAPLVEHVIRRRKRNKRSVCDCCNTRAIIINTDLKKTV